VAGKFSAAVGAWVLASEQRMAAVMKESVQRLVTQIQNPIGHGGWMPVDTGFLRASFQLSLDGVPTGVTENTGAPVAYDASATTRVLLKWSVGQTIYGGWTANYAVYMEAYYAFARRGMQNWANIVRTVAIEARERANGR
jgi:hypothetical protein